MLLVLSGLWLLAAWAAMALMRGRSAAERYLVWLLAFAGLLLLPVLRERAPGWRAPEAVRGMARRTVVYVTAGEAAPAQRRLPLREVWMAGVALCLARLAQAHAQAARVARAARAHEPGVRVSDEVSVPMVCGLWRPVILLPPAALNWPREQRERVLAHERMHIARGDNFSQAMARIACAFYWPQPLVWLGARAMRQECERACDDGVLAGGTAASAYAATLINVARGLSPGESALTGGLAMTRTTQLHGRIAALLDVGTARRPAGRRFTAGAATIALAAVLALAGLETPLFGQKSRLAGSVKDPSGAGIPKARIDLRTPGTDTVREVIYTDAAGEFSLDNVPDGTYDMTVAAPGFALLTQSNLVFENGKTEPFKINLNLGKIRERVKVEDTAAPAASKGAPSRIRVGGNVQSSRLVHRVAPLYPPTARQERVEGTVLLRAVVGIDGSVLNLEPLNRAVDARLVEVSLAAVRQWRYSPTLLNGQPVEIVTEVEINFTLAP